MVNSFDKALGGDADTTRLPHPRSGDYAVLSEMTYRRLTAFKIFINICIISNVNSEALR